MNFGKKLRYIFFAFFIVIALYTNRNHIKVNLYTEIPLKTYLESEITTNSFNEYLPILADSKLLNKSTDFAEGQNLEISNVKQTTDSLSLTLATPMTTRVSLKQFSFPGQTLYLDHNATTYETDEDGRISFQLPAGLHDVSVKYEEQFLVKIAKALTFFGILILVIFTIFRLY